MKPTKDEVFQIAEANGVECVLTAKDNGVFITGTIHRLVSFAQACYAAGVKAENEACEQIAETSPSKYHCVAAIRERRK